MSGIKRRYFLREKEATKLLNDFTQKLNTDINQLFKTESRVEVAETQTAKIYFINHKPLLALQKNILLPTLLFQKALQLLPKIVVNMGAVPHICNGADVMAPGVVRIEKDYKPNDYVLINDERHNKPLAIALALTDSETARSLKHGKLAQNLHYVGDNLWNQLKT